MTEQPASLLKIGEGVWAISGGDVTADDTCVVVGPSAEYRVEMQVNGDRHRSRRVSPPPAGEWSEWKEMIREEPRNTIYRRVRKMFSNLLTPTR